MERMPFEQWAKNVLNCYDIELLNKALGKQDADKLVHFIYDEKIAGNTVSGFVLGITQEYELDRYRRHVQSYLNRHFYTQAAINEDFVNAVADKVYIFRDQEVFTLTEDIEKAICMIAFSTADDDGYPQEFIDIASDIWKHIK